MAHQYPKQPCHFLGCRAWAVHGGEFCVSHRRRTAKPSQTPAPTPADAPPLAPLIAAAHHGEGASLDSLEMLEEELRMLLLARRVFLRWLDAHADANELSPAQFLKAWLDSSARMVQLLRARRELGGEGAEGGDLQRLLDAVYRQVEGVLPGEPG